MVRTLSLIILQCGLPLLDLTTDYINTFIMVSSKMSPVSSALGFAMLVSVSESYKLRNNFIHLTFYMDLFPLVLKFPARIFVASRLRFSPKVGSAAANLELQPIWLKSYRRTH